MPLTFVEVCAGAGGLSCGLLQAGLTPLLLNDNDKNCCATLVKNHPEANVVCASMLDLDLTPFHKKVDLLTGGVPCQAFSQAGNRKGFDDPRGNLILTFTEQVRQVAPKLFLIENVKGLVSHDGGRSLERVLELLRLDGQYEVEWRILNAAEYGVPQKRERVFIVGVRCEYRLPFVFPVKDEAVTVLGDVLTDVPASAGAAYPEKKLVLFREIPQGGCWINLPVEAQKVYLGASYYSGGGKRGILHRESLAKPALTVLCSPSQKQTERCHPLEDRPFTVRENARIQTFPDDYEFTGSMSSQYKQVGNAVPVELARRLGVAVKEWLEKVAA